MQRSIGQKKSLNATNSLHKNNYIQVQSALQRVDYTLSVR